MSEPCQERPALAGHKALLTHQARPHRDIEQPLCALSGQVDRAVAVAVGEQAGKAAFEFRNLVCLHLSDRSRSDRNRKSHYLMGFSLQT